MRTSLLGFGCLAALCIGGMIPCAQGQVTVNAPDHENAGSGRLRTKQIDPSDLFLEVRKLSMAGERLIKSGDHEAALKAYAQADKYLDALQSDHSSWRPELVRFRRNENAKNKGYIQKKLAEANALAPVQRPLDAFLNESHIKPQNEIAGVPVPVPGVIVEKSAREIELENRLREILKELHTAREQVKVMKDEIRAVAVKRKEDTARLQELEKQLAQLRDPNLIAKTDREKELEAQIEELQKARDASSTEREKKLEEELQLARETASKSRANREEELMRQIKSLTELAQNKTDRERQLERELSQVRAEMDGVRTKREIELQKRLEETMVQLAAAHDKIDELQRGALGSGTGAAYDALNQEYLRAQAELKVVTKALRDTRITLENTMTRAVHAETGEATYKNQLAKLRQQLQADRAVNNKVVETTNKQIKALEERLAAAQTEKAQAATEVKNLQERLKETEDQLTDVTKQKEAIELERNQLADLIKLNNPGTTKALLDENMTLAHHLKTVQEKLAALESEHTEQSSMLEATRTELALVKRRMIELRDENVDYRKRVSELREKLRGLEIDLEKASSQPDVDPHLVAENELLRETIARQLKVLSSREKSRELLVEAYKRLKLQDPQMREAIQLLDRSEDMVLTDRDHELLDKLPDSIDSPEAYAKGIVTPAQQLLAYNELQNKVYALSKSASDAYEKGRYHAAEQLYQTLMEEHPGQYAAHINLGVIFLKQNRMEEACKILQNAVDLNPNHPTGQFLLGVALYRGGRDAAAQMALMASVNVDPANARAFFYLGNIAASAGKTAAAIKDYQKALEIDPTLVDIYYNMATAYANAGKLDEARKSYDYSIRAGALPDPVLEKRLRISRPPAANPGTEKTNESEQGAGEALAVDEKRTAV